MSYDINSFEKILLEEARNAFCKIIEDCKDEQIYSLAFYNSGDSWTYLFPTVSTIKGLDEISNQYQDNEFYHGKSFEQLKTILKWSPCDSPKHDIYEELLPNTDLQLVEFTDYLDTLYFQRKEKEYFDLQKQLVTHCMSVLRQLESGGVFASLNRDSFVLNLLNGDQSEEERLHRAKLLNPPLVYQNFKSELLATSE